MHIRFVVLVATGLIAAVATSVGGVPVPAARSASPLPDAVAERAAPTGTGPQPPSVAIRGVAAPSPVGCPALVVVPAPVGCPPLVVVPAPAGPPAPVVAPPAVGVAPGLVTAPASAVPGPSLVALSPGAEGVDVVRLQDRLVELHYEPGEPDGRYGPETASAVMAFQKVTGLPRTGVATTDTVAALEVATDPAPLVAGGAPTRVEVDMARQVLFVWRSAALVKVLPVSTGHGRRYCDNGVCGVAVTPRGSFSVERRVEGLRRAPLGVLHNPVYFHGGFAIHGSPSVPAQPASHGCVRVPIHASRWVFDHVADATPVHVI